MRNEHALRPRNWLALVALIFLAGARPLAAAEPETAPPKATFNDKPGMAQRVVYVCAAGESMRGKMDALREQLHRAIVQLRPSQSFAVITFGGDGAAATTQPAVFATPQNKVRAIEFVEALRAGGHGDVVAAMQIAMELKPQLIFLLSDSALGDGEALLKYLRQANADQKVRISTLAFLDEQEEYPSLLKTIARENGGVFKPATRPTSLPASASAPASRGD